MKRKIVSHTYIQGSYSTPNGHANYMQLQVVDNYGVIWKLVSYLAHDQNGNPLDVKQKWEKVQVPKLR